MEIYSKISEVNLKLDLQYYSNISPVSFYWNSPVSAYEFVCFDVLVDFSDIKDLSELSQIYNFKFAQAHSGKLFNFPLCVGASSFNEKDEFWKPFGKHNWFIPRFVLLKDVEKTFFITNFTSLDDKDELDYTRKILLTKLKQLVQPKDKAIKTKMVECKELEQNFIEYADKTCEVLKENKISKIVPAFYRDLTIHNEYNQVNILSNLIALNGKAYIYSYKNGDKTFMGASPENLLSFKDDTVSIDALAGTAPKKSNYSSLLSDTKNINEHNYVKTFVAENLAKYTTEISSSDEPQLKILNDLVHLHTPFTAKMNDRNQFFSLLNDVFPTPAVCGYPKDSAYNFINEEETFSRGLYSGAIGFIGKDYGEVAVGIRSALLDKEKVRIFAGAGFVNGSESQNELSEIDAKMQTILKAIH